MFTQYYKGAGCSRPDFGLCWDKSILDVAAGVTGSLNFSLLIWVVLLLRDFHSVLVLLLNSTTFLEEASFSLMFSCSHPAEESNEEINSHFACGNVAFCVRGWAGAIGASQKTVLIKNCGQSGSPGEQNKIFGTNLEIHLVDTCFLWKIKSPMMCVSRSLQQRSIPEYALGVRLSS